MASSDDPRSFRLRPLGLVLNLLATSPLVVGGAFIVLIWPDDTAGVVLGLALLVVGAAIAVRVCFARVPYNDEAVRIVGMLRSWTVPRSQVVGVKRDIRRPSITWWTEAGRLASTPIEVVMMNASELFRKNLECGERTT